MSTSVWHDKTDKTPRTGVSDRVLSVYVHDDAMMTVPRGDWLWELNWTDEPERGTLCTDRQLGVSVGESFRYLVLECTKEEAWHRIKQMRAAILAYDKTEE